MGVENPLTIQEISMALTASDSRNDWASKSAATTAAAKKGRGLLVPIHPMLVF